MYKIKNSKELASLINCINLNNMISEEEMEEYLDKVGKLNFNSITISPTYVSLAKEKLADSTTKISTVVGFPLGFETAEGKIAQAAKALEDGADEIESVINLNHLKDHKYNLIHEELKQLRELLGDKTLKVIVEMQTIDDSEKASIAKVLEENKVDFIKTSTGFIAPDNIYSKVNDINIIQKYAPQLKIEIYGGVDTYKLANQLLTGGADLIGSNCGYEIVEKYRTLRENTQVTPKPIRFD
ncbi:deoxyribose-phosphate aldolase [Methanobrevibacter sp. TLL-48-HuF1]|uniref:deoxyribose-phosphate aldolase n=1 Tax=Methanobrevibacter TaxID=2172 RepID=UPI0020262476|nr:deoxyribose-phosphate aldolase [Methanobrevibacter sp. TLL-48-HuF1]URN49085.1 deoxyribose-phosphate aldolase [Methanobrevibacter sp. TLL-48-HuF1]